MSNVCYTVILGNKPGERIGLVKQGEIGYYPCKGYDYAPNSLEEVRTHVDELNERMGVPKDVEESMTAASHFGWDIPAARRANEFWAEEKERLNLSNGGRGYGTYEDTLHGS